MKTRIHFNVHEKCIKILDMIHELNNRKESVRNDLYQFDNSPDPYHPVKLFNTREKLVTRQAYLRVIETRLIQYYDSTLMKVIPDTIKRSLPESCNMVQVAERFTLTNISL